MLPSWKNGISVLKKCSMGQPGYTSGPSGQYPPPLPPPAPEYLSFKKKKKKRKSRKFFRSVWFPVTLVVAVFVFIGAYVQWGSDLLADLVSVENEKALGVAIMKQVTAGSPPVRNEVLTRRLTSLVLQVQAAMSGGRTAPWEQDPRVKVIDMRMPNAFALPGGTIIITRGLLCSAVRGEEVAYVLAHEMGHVHYRHSLRQAVRGLGLQFIVTVFTGGSQSDLWVFMLNNTYSRNFERQADVYALEAGRKLGWSADNFASILQRISEKIGDTDTLGDFAVLRDHPVLKERLELCRRYPAANVSGHDSLSDVMNRIHSFCR